MSGSDLTLKMTSAQVVETSVNVPSNTPSQYYTHPNDHNIRTYELGRDWVGGGGGWVPEVDEVITNLRILNKRML